MADNKIGDYNLFANAMDRKPALSDARYIEEGQKLTEGSFKGKGFFGEIPTKDGSMMTEYSSAFEVGGKTISYPLVVPTLTADELNLLRLTGNVTPDIDKKAQQYALDRIAQGKNPFASPTALKVLKKIGFVVIGGSGDAIAIKWGFDYKENYNSETKLLDTGVVYEYNVGEYNIAEFSNGVVLDQFQINAGGNGAVLQLGLEAELNGDPLSIQKIDVYVAQGKTV